MRTKITNQGVVFGRYKILPIYEAVTRRFLTALIVVLMVAANTVSQSLIPVNLRTAGNYVILAKSGISTIPTSAIVGDIGVSPIDQTAITGFSLIADPSNVFATSSQITGRIFGADFADPTPSNLTTAIGDMETAYVDAAGRTNPDFTEPGAGEIGGLTLVPGLYKWSTDVLITTDVTLNGSSNDVWIFQIAGGITMANGKSVILTGGAKSKNIFWQSFGSVAIGTNAHFEGIVLAQTSITIGTGASVNGILLTQTAVTLDANAVTRPTDITGVETESTPHKAALSQNYPNPFNPSTSIRYNLEKAGMVSLKIYNLLGKEVATLVNANQNAGSYTVQFNTNLGKLNLSSGVYLYRLETESFVSVKKFVLLK